MTLITGQSWVQLDTRIYEDCRATTETTGYFRAPFSNRVCFRYSLSSVDRLPGAQQACRTDPRGVKAYLASFSSLDELRFVIEKIKETQQSSTSSVNKWWVSPLMDRYVHTATVGVLKGLTYRGKYVKEK